MDTSMLKCRVTGLSWRASQASVFHSLILALGHSRGLGRERGRSGLDTLLETPVQRSISHKGVAHYLNLNVVLHNGKETRTYCHLPRNVSVSFEF